MGKKKKVLVKAIERIDETEVKMCKTCKYYLKAKNGGICLKHIAFKYPTQMCGEHVIGECETLNELEKLEVLRRFVTLQVNIKLMQEELNTLKLIIAEHFQHKEQIEDFKVYINEVEQKRLNTEAVKELLETLPNKDDYYQISRFTRVQVKKVA